jgi:Fic family protein
LLVPILLQHWQLLSHPLLYLSAYLERHRQAYVDCLLNVTKEGKWEEWVVFFLKGVEEQSRDAIARAAGLQDLRNEWRIRLIAERASDSVMQLADRLFESPVVSVPDVEQYLDTTYRTAARSIQKLVSNGILQPLGESTYRRSFIAPTIIRTIEGRQPFPHSIGT